MKSTPVSPVSWLAPLSVLLAVSGAAIGFFRYKGLTDQTTSVEVIREEYSRSRKGLLSLSYHAFYLDWMYVKLLSPFFIKVAQWIHWFDKQWIDGFIHLVGVGTVLFSKAIDLMDKLVVDGLVNLIGWIQVAVGNFIRLLHANRLQLHFFWAVLLLVLVIIGFELF